MTVSDPNTPASADDDWSAALAEQSAAASDPWAEALAEQAGGTPAAATVATTPPSAGSPVDSGSSPGQGADASQATRAAPGLFKPLGGSGTSAGNDIDMIMDVPVQLTVELGRTRLTIKNLLQLGQGSVVELDGLAGEPMDIYVNGYLIAQGEVVVVEEKYGIRLTDIITPSERINRLNNRR